MNESLRGWNGQKKATESTRPTRSRSAQTAQNFGSSRGVESLRIWCDQIVWVMENGRVMESRFGSWKVVGGPGAGEVLP